jgi:hypothetical protein
MIDRDKERLADQAAVELERTLLWIIPGVPCRREDAESALASAREMRQLLIGVGYPPAVHEKVEQQSDRIVARVEELVRESRTD